MARKKPRHEAHVRLYKHELESAAYRSLSPDARALLVEMRSLFNGRENRLYMSIREAMRRLGAGQRRAQHARDELLDRGFVRLLTPGGFTRKYRHAAEYALTNEPLEDKDGASAPKDFMRWQSQKNTVAKTATDGSQNDYLKRQHRRPKGRDGSQNSYLKGQKRRVAGSQNGYTDKLPRSADFLGAALQAQGREQLRLILLALLVAYQAEAGGQKAC